MMQTEFPPTTPPGIRTRSSPFALFKRGLLIAIASLLLGGAASLPMSLVEHAWLWRVAIPRPCDFVCTAQFLFSLPAVAGALFAAGALFGVAAQRLAGSGSPLFAA